MLIATLTALVACQQEPGPTTGILMDIPLTVMAANPAQSDELTLSETGEGPLPMQVADPRFDIATIVPLPSGSNLTINSFSGGTGALFTVMEAADHVHPSVPSEGWSFMLFTVSGTGWNSGSIYDAEASAIGGITGDVFCYIVAGSEAWVPDDQNGIVQKVREGSEIGLGTLAGIDSFLSGLAATADYVEDAEEGMGGSRVSFYFTLISTTDASAYDNIPTTWNTSSASDWNAPSTIFVNHWDAATGWSGPTVWKTSSDLDLDPGTEIDALTVMDPEFVGAPAQMKGVEVLLSTTTPKLEQQLWICGTWSLPSAPTTSITYRGPLRDQSAGLFVKSALGLTSDQQGVTSSCDDDPGEDSGNAIHHRLRRERTALLDSEGALGNTNLDYSLHQIQWHENTNFTRYRATFQGFAGQTDAYAELRLRGVQTPVLTVARNPNARGLDKRSLELRIPFYALPEPEPVTLQWIVYDRFRQRTGVSDVFKILAR